MGGRFTKATVLRIAVAGYITSALVTTNTVLVSRVNGSAVAVSFTIALCWAYAVAAVAKTDTMGKLAYATASAAGCATTLWSFQ